MNKKEVRCCKAISGLCKNKKCSHWWVHDKGIDWRGTGKSCGQWSICKFLNPEKDSINVRCISLEG